MGTDIHLYVEYKDDDGKWILDKKQECKNCNAIEAAPPDDICCSYCYGDGYIDLDINRSYCLFSILADVRNGDYELNPISDPRGIPVDASEQYKKIAENDPCIYHSHSYHSLKQLKEHEWKYEGEKYDWEYLKGYFPIDLEDLAIKHGGDDNVRIVFFFDN